MKITLEFENSEKFFKELPKFAALVGYSSQFATFNHVPKSQSEPELQDPTFPNVEPLAEGGFKVSGTPEQVAALKTADAVAKATNEATESRQKAQEDAEAKKVSKSTPKEEEAQDAPETKADEAQETAAAVEEKTEVAEAVNAPEDVTEAEIKKTLTKLSKAGHKAEVRAILNKFGASGFPDFKEKPQHFAEAFELATAKIEELGLDKEEE